MLVGTGKSRCLVGTVARPEGVRDDHCAVSALGAFRIIRRHSRGPVSPNALMGWKSSTESQAALMAIMRASPSSNP